MACWRMPAVRRVATTNGRSSRTSASARRSRLQTEEPARRLGSERFRPELDALRPTTASQVPFRRRAALTGAPDARARLAAVSLTEVHGLFARLTGFRLTISTARIHRVRRPDSARQGRLRVNPDDLSYALNSVINSRQLGGKPRSRPWGWRGRLR